MKFKNFLILLLVFSCFLNIINCSQEQKIEEGTCPSNDHSCNERMRAKQNEQKNQNSNSNHGANNNDLEIEDIPNEQKEEIKKLEEIKKKANQTIVFKSKKSGLKKENEPERENITYPEDFEHQELFQRWGERRKYLHSFKLESNYTEYYDFNLDDEELYSLHRERITYYPPIKFAKNFQGNFLHFYKVLYEKKLPVYLTTDSMLYGFNENLQRFENTFYEEIFPMYFATFLKNVINYINELLESPDGEDHKYFISHAQLFFATTLELLTNRQSETNSYMPAIQTQLKNFLDKIYSYKDSQEFFMFYNKRVINCQDFIPTTYFSRNIARSNVYAAIKWFQLNRFIYEPNFVTPIWYLGKMIVDSGQLELFTLIYDSLKFVMGMDSLTYSPPEIYNIGVKQLGYKDIFDLSPEQADKLFLKVISMKKTLDLPYLNDNIYYSKEEKDQFTIERELSTALFDYHFDTEDWVKNKLLIMEKSRLRTILRSQEIPSIIHQVSYYKEYIFGKYRGEYNSNQDPNIPLRDGIDLRRIFEPSKYSIKDIMVFNPEKFRTSIKNGIHLLLYKASRRIKSYDPVFNRNFYHQKNANIAYAGYVDFKRDFHIMKSDFEPKKVEGEFADVVVEPNVGFYEEMLELTKCYKNMFNKLENYGINKLHMKKNPQLSNLNFSFRKLKGYFNHLEECVKMLLMVIKKQENGVELDEELKEYLYNIVKFEKKYNTWTGWYLTLLNPNDTSSVFDFYSWSKKVVAALPNEDHKFLGAMIYLNTHYPLIGLIVKEDKFNKKKKLLLFSSYQVKETLKMFDPKKLEFKAEIEKIDKRR